MDEEKKSEGSWWRTVPGILTTAAGTITALTGLIAALQQSGCFRTADKSGEQSKAEAPADPSASPARPQSSSPTAAPIVEARVSAKPDAPPRPWSQSEAVVTSIDGVTTALNAESLGNCISSTKELTLSNGQSIGFEKMRSFEFMRDGIKPVLIVTLLTGKTVQGNMSMGCEIVGTNDLGRFNLAYEKIKRVEFKR